MFLYFALKTVKINKNKKSVKFQGDILNFYDFIQIFLFTSNHHLSIFFSEFRPLLHFDTSFNNVVKDPIGMNVVGVVNCCPTSSSPLLWFWITVINTALAYIVLSTCFLARLYKLVNEAFKFQIILHAKTMPNN